MIIAAWVKIEDQWLLLVVSYWSLLYLLQAVKRYTIWRNKYISEIVGRYRMLVGFTTTCAISVPHHWCGEFESSHGEVYSIQHYVIKFISDLRQVGGFLQVPWFPVPINLTTMINWNIVEVTFNTITVTLYT